MIKKLKDKEEREIRVLHLPNGEKEIFEGDLFTRTPDLEDVINKVNEIIDVLNNTMMGR